MESSSLSLVLSGTSVSGGVGNGGGGGNAVTANCCTLDCNSWNMCCSCGGKTLSDLNIPKNLLHCAMWTRFGSGIWALIEL